MKDLKFVSINILVSFLGPFSKYFEYFENVFRKETEILVS